MIWETWLRRAGRAARAGRPAPQPARPRAADDPVVDLAGNDYLGLSRHPAVVAAARPRRRARGAPGRAPPGWSPARSSLHAELEAASPAFLGQPAALVHLDRLPRQPRGGHRAGRPRLPDRLRRPRPRLAGRRRPARPGRGDGRPPQRRGRRLARRSPARASAGRWCSPSRSTPCSATPRRCSSWPASARRTTPCWSSTRPTASAWPAPAGAGWCASSGSPGRTDVVVTATLSKALGAQGGAVARRHRGRRAPGQPGPAVHLRHRPRAGRRGAARWPRSTCCVADPSCPALVRERVGGLAAALGVPAPAGAVLSVPMPSPAGRAGRPGRGARRGRPGRLLPPAVGARRRLAAADHRPAPGIDDADWARAASVLGQVVKEYGA